MSKSGLRNRANKAATSSKLGRRVYNAIHSSEQEYHCPICQYQGVFLAKHTSAQTRPSATCPSCGADERHRLQGAALSDRQLEGDILHVAPEASIGGIMKANAGSYTTLDLVDPSCDYQADLCHLPFDDDSFDVVYASHVLEHIAEDRLALSEISRVLRPAGTAVLPVPIFGPTTVEYGRANDVEYGHVRAPGLDYFDRYRQFFSEVVVVSSDDVDGGFQPYIHEDRSSWPASMPDRPTSSGWKHADYVPFCIGPF